MRILSNFKDYYDHVQALGQEPGVVYERRRTPDRAIEDRVFGRAEWRQAVLPAKALDTYLEPILTGAMRRLMPLRFRNDTDNRFYQDLVIVGFAGELRAFYVRESRKNGELHRCWNIEDIERTFPSTYEQILSKRSFWHHDVEVAKSGPILPAVEALELFQILREPIFALPFSSNLNRGESKVTINALVNFELRGIDFQRQVDAYTGFQKLQTFVENYLKPQKELVELSDRERLEKAGFDKTISFRHPVKSSKAS